MAFYTRLIIAFIGNCVVVINAKVLANVEFFDSYINLSQLLHINLTAGPW